MNLQILNNLFEIMKSVGVIISPYLLYQYGDLRIFFFLIIKMSKLILCRFLKKNVCVGNIFKKNVFLKFW